MPKVDEELLARARKMRSQPTPTEAQMWRILCAKQFEGVKFARQVVIAPYIAISPTLSLDCASSSSRSMATTHGLCEVKDAQRTLGLESWGYRVIRFTNFEVGSNRDGVAHAISAALAALPLSQPSPQKGEG